MFKRIIAAWRAFFATTTAPVAVSSEPEPDARRKGISQAALWESERHGTPVFTPEMVFQRPKPAPGVMPTGMAMDDCLPPMNNMAEYAYASMFHEGLGFLGYPYLAELCQRAEYHQMASIWAQHAIRKWIKFTGPDAKVKELEDELKRLDVRELYRTAIEKECQFGRVQIFPDFGDSGNPRELLTPLLIDGKKINPSRPLKSLKVVEPLWSYPGSYNSANPLAPDFYKPSQWYVNGMIVHASRLVTLVDRPVADMLKPAYAFGGLSLTQIAKPYVDNWLRSRQSASDIQNAFSVMTLGTEMDQVLTGVMGAEIPLFARIDMFNKTRSNRGTFVYDKSTEEFGNVAAPIAGLHELVAQAQEQMCSVSGIPPVMLTGSTPTGLNASTDGEIRVFYDGVMSYNEKTVAPGLGDIINMVQLSLWGKIDKDIAWAFNSLWEMSDKDKSEIRKADAEADVAYINGGVIDPEETRDRLNNEEGGMYHGLLTGPAPEPPEMDETDEAETDGKLPQLDGPKPKKAANDGALDEWNEGDHPRAENGEFGSGGGSSAKAKPKLTAREKTEVDRYSGDHFLKVNTELRGGDVSDPSVKHLDSAIAKSSLPAGQKLFRGMTRDAAKKLFVDGHIQVGAEISDKAFVSTSKSRGIAGSSAIGGVMLEIETADGAKGLDVSALSRNNHEQEVILPRDAKMTVVGIKAPKSPGDPVRVRLAYGGTIHAHDSAEWDVVIFNLDGA